MSTPFKPTEAQLQIVSKVSPTMIVDGVFQGDDNDLAVIISKSARMLAEAGLVAAAVKMEFDHSPPGFHNANREEFTAFFTDIANKAKQANEPT